MPETPQKFFLTTPIYYVNARPHIGHAYTTIVADVLARRSRAQGIDTFFLTGTDEHGQKIERSAAAAGIPPQQFADEVSHQFRSLWDRLGLTYDQFIRTTDPAHKRGAQKLFATLYERGFIYLASYTGQYCVSDEAFVDVPPGGLCPDCGRVTETLTEENFFFKLSEFQQPLLDLIESNSLLITPDTARNEVLSFIRGKINPSQTPFLARAAEIAGVEEYLTTQEHVEDRPDNGQIRYTSSGKPYLVGSLKDLSISRSSFTWGIPVPEPAASAAAHKHVIYVWLDALANYMTALGYGSEDESKWEHYWPADLHLVGKEITRFHCVYWPAFLMAAGIATPKAVTANGWLLFDNSKMSKSKGNVVRTETILDAFGTLCPAPPPLTTPDPTQNLVILSEAKDPCISSAPAQISTPEAALEPTPHQRELIAADNLRKGTPSAVPQTPENEPLGRPRLQPWLSPGAAETGLQPLGHSAADLKHFLLREIPFGQDGSFSFEALITRYNADLANGYGNLVSRTLHMIGKYFDGVIPLAHRPWLCSRIEAAQDIRDSVDQTFFYTENLIHLFTGPENNQPTSLLDELRLGPINIAITAVDAYLSHWKPWSLAKSHEDTERERLGEVLYTAAESIRIITLLLNPILPYATAKVWAQLGLNPADLTSEDKQLRTENRQLRTEWGGLQPGTKLGPLSPIFPRADKGLAQIMNEMENPQPIACVTGPNDPPAARLSAITAQHDALTPATGDLPVAPIASEAPSHDPAAGPRTSTLAEPNPGQHVAASAAVTTERPGTPSHTEAPASGIFASQPTDASPQITIDDFAKIDLRVAQIVVAERIPKADKLLRLEVDLGYETRQILSGIAEWYTPEELIGRRIVVITNLAPRKMRGLESHGMLLAASAPAAEGEAGGKPHLATFTGDETLPLGSRLK